jgi:flavin-dependent dehydrogenase
LTHLPKTTDVFIVGGGPAGLAAGIATRLKGFDVTVADAARPPIEKTCGEGLMPDSVTALRELGVKIDSDLSYDLRGIRFLGDGVSVEGKFPGAHGIGMRRLRLHQTLIHRASEAGVRLLWGARVTGMDGEYVRLDERRVRYRWLIGADGQNSPVRRWAGLDAARSESFRCAFRRHYRVSPWTNHVEIYWGTGHQMYVTPVGREEVGVVLITRNSRSRLEQVLPQYPELQIRLEGAFPLSAERGAVTGSRSLRRIFRGSTILIGDASGSIDAITGEGLSLSFRQAVALAEALTAGDLRSYQTEHQRLARRPAFMGRLLLSLDRYSWLRRRALRALSSRPEIFAHLLAMHVSQLPAADFLFRGMLPLGWQILTG